MGALSAFLFVVSAIAIVTTGDRRPFLGLSVTPGTRPVVTRVASDGPAAGLLQPGDSIVAINGDARVIRLGVTAYRRFLTAGSTYTVTAVHDGVTRNVTLSVDEIHGPDQALFSESLWLSAFVWCAVATLIAVFKPDQTAARAAYVAGMALGLFLLGQARGPALIWASGWQLIVLLWVFPFAPLHLAVGYDFYLRFPPGLSTATGIWRKLRLVIYVTCAVLCLEGSLLSVVALMQGPDAYLAVRERLVGIDVWLDWAYLVYPITGLAILAALARNYRAATDADDRRRMRWLLWGTIVGLTPFVIFQVIQSVTQLGGIAFSLGPYAALANLATTAIPISFGYAIVKHRVFDITVVIRRGLQYLLAKNALRVILVLPMAGLMYGLAMHRDQPLRQLWQSNSIYLYLALAAVISLKFRLQLSQWLDRLFFREAYDRERILLGLIDQVEQLDSVSTMSKLVSQELEAAFHPRCLFIWYREGDKPGLTLSYSSGGYIRHVELEPNAPLVRYAELETGVIERQSGVLADVPPADREWLDDVGVRLIVPLMGGDRSMLGLLMLGDKKSDEPYSAADKQLLQAIARQIVMARENVRLKDRVHRDRRIQHEVIARLEAGHVSLLKECPACGGCYDSATNTCAEDGAELQLTLPVERTIDGKYRLDRLIGKGGMGAVYEAADLRLARAVAVKIMQGRTFGDRQAMWRFQREAQASARLTHPNIVTVFDFGAAGADGAFLVMELLRGRTLRSELSRRGRLPPATAAAWLGQIGNAVGAAHTQGIVHRDLKPENVIVTASAAGEDLLKVLDFGLAKMRTADEDLTGAVTDPGAIMGTVGYMAPEQLMGGDTNERSDIFALGVIAAEAITGRRPFRGRTPAELLLSIERDTLQFDIETPEWRRLESVLRRALAHDPANRYGSVAEYLQYLLPALERLPGQMATQGADETTIGS